VAAGLVAYCRTFSAPLVFDDVGSIAENPTIRHLGDLGAVLSPPSSFIEASGVSSRPLINLSLAINFFFGGLDPRGYHAVNLAIHLSASLVLFGIVRRTLVRIGPRTGGTHSAGPTLTAFAAALLWCVHPLQTESVTCIIQRTESLMGLFYLLTLYSFIRATEASGRPRLWSAAAVACCLLGMAGKETMATAPLVIFLYDRTFVSGGFREAWRKRRGLHLALAATWILLGALVLRAGLGARGIGSESAARVQSLGYLLTQCRAVVLYLKLSVWPHPLVVDYGTGLVSGLSAVWPQAVGLVALLAIVSWAVVSRPALGFLGAWFFVILCPSSTVVPLLGQTIAEHRMYLSLASVTVLAAVVLDRWLGRAALPGFLLLAAALCIGTFRRNEVYLSDVTLWTDTVASCPENPRAHNNLGVALMAVPGRHGDAVAQYREALRLNPDFAPAHNNLGLALVDEPGRLDDAVVQFREAIRLIPGFAQAHCSLGKALAQTPGRQIEAIAELEEAIRLIPDFAEAHDSLGVALASLPGRKDDAIAQYREALRLKPDFAEAHNNLGIALGDLPGRGGEAAAEFLEALRLRPDYAEAHNNLGNAYSGLPGRQDDAVAQYREALRLNPGFAEAHFDLAVALLKTGHRADAEANLEEGLRLEPGDVQARRILDQVRALPDSSR
jgi:tetratricopeptide (TPR) repeat protein